jgi:hypothetical protein
VYLVVYTGSYLAALIENWGLVQEQLHVLCKVQQQAAGNLCLRPAALQLLVQGAATCQYLKLTAKEMFFEAVDYWPNHPALAHICTSIMNLDLQLLKCFVRNASYECLATVFLL